MRITNLSKPQFFLYFQKNFLNRHNLVKPLYLPCKVFMCILHYSFLSKTGAQLNLSKLFLNFTRKNPEFCFRSWIDLISTFDERPYALWSTYGKNVTQLIQFHFYNSLESPQINCLRNWIDLVSILIEGFTNV